MPWSAKDAGKYKKGLTPSQKKKWASIANSVYADCKKKKGKDCAGKAIRIANSKFSGDLKMSKKNEIPKGALRLVEHGTACCEFVEDDGKKPRLKMTAYSGGIIKGHWWWGNLAIDLSGMKFSSAKYPILENHWSDRKIAFTSKPIITDDNKLEINSEKTEFVDTEASLEFQKLSAQGFPYQASIYAKPIEIQRLMEKETAEVNGLKFNGPGTIWHKCEFKEASVCVFGWDTKTKSSAFSRTEMEEVDCDGIESFSLPNDIGDDIDKNTQLEGGEKNMDLAQFKKDHPEVAEKFMKEVTDKVTAELTTKFDQEKTTLETKLTSQSDQIAQLQKNDAIRAERELALQADNIFEAQLAQSDVSEHLHEKVKVMVRHTKFTADGVLDVEKFTEAVNAEIKDWEDRGATSTVIGAGRLSKTETGNDSTKSQLSEENQKMTASLLARAGQSEEKK